MQVSTAARLPAFVVILTGFGHFMKRARGGAGGIKRGAGEEGGIKGEKGRETIEGEGGGSAARARQQVFFL